jgi:hypothetical protein
LLLRISSKMAVVSLCHFPRDRTRSFTSSRLCG